jgi:alpha-glucosidase
VEALEGTEGSTLELYRTGLRVRREHLIADEEFEWMESPAGTLVFRRGSGVVVAVNCSSEPLALPPGEVLVASDDASAGTLPPDAAAWVLPARGDIH